MTSDGKGDEVGREQRGGLVKGEGVGKGREEEREGGK